MPDTSKRTPTHVTVIAFTTPDGAHYEPGDQVAVDKKYIADLEARGAILPIEDGE